MGRAARRTLFIALAGISMQGCQKPAPPAAPEERTAETKTTGSDPVSKIAKRVEGKIAAVTALAKDERKALTPEEYEKLILALASCSLNERGIDPACAEHKQYEAARSRNTSLKDFAGLSSSLGVKHLTHQSPAVRLVAAGLLKSFFGSNPASQDAVLKAIETEKEPVVIRAMLSAVGSAGSKNPKIGELLIKMADHEAEGVRIETLSWLSSSWGVGVPKGVEKVMEKIEKDSSMNVRRAACAGAGRTGSEKVIPLLKKMTKSAEENPELYSSCMQGLIDLWNPFVGDNPPSKTAYTLSLARLRDKPRSKNRPPWAVMRSLGRVPKSNPAWYKQGEVAKALLDVALDEQANWMARSGAARALGELKAVEQLNAIKQGLATKTDFDSKNVVKAAEEGLAKK